MPRQVWLLCGTLTTLATTPTIAQSVSETLIPVADTFVRERDPFATYGGAGALHVSAASATNAVGVEQGLAEAWLRFDAATAVRRFDTAFGLSEWELVSAELSIDSVATPNNALFDRGPGRVNVFWVADDGWTEGAGKPLVPGAVIGSDLSYHSASSRRDPSVDQLIGSFEHTDANGAVRIPLQLASGFSRRLVGANRVTILLAPDDSEVGLTFHSRTWSVAGGRPGLTLVAQPAPDPDSEAPLGDIGEVDVDPEIVEPEAGVPDESEDIPESDSTADGDGQPPGIQTGPSPGKGDLPEEDEEELEILDSIGQDASPGTADENEEPFDVEDTPSRCGAGLVVPGMLMLLAFRVVIAQIAMRRGT